MDYSDFSKDFSSKYSDIELEEVNTLIDKALESEDSSKIFSGDTWSLSFDIEKEHSLQYYYHLNLSKEVDGECDEEVNLTFESGINNGTELNDYDLDGAPTVNPFKVVEVLKDLKPDWSRYEVDISDNRKRLIQSVLDIHKDDILGIYNDQNYDNYVTGGGTSLTNKHYSDKFTKYDKMSLYWTCLYEDVQVDRAFI